MTQKKKNSWIFSILIPLLLFCLFAFVVFNFIDSTSVSFSTLEYGFGPQNFIHLKTDRLLQGNKVTASFTSPDKYLGIVAVRFNTFNRTSNDVVAFSIKEKGQSGWYARNKYKVDQF